MEIKLKGRDMPRSATGEVKFATLGLEEGGLPGPDSVMGVFNDAEIVELVNRAIYQLEYQRESHRKRSANARALVKIAEEEMKKAGVDVAGTKIKQQLEGK